MRNSTDGVVGILGLQAGEEVNQVDENPMESTLLAPTGARLRLVSVDGVPHDTYPVYRTLSGELDLSPAQCIKRAMLRSSYKPDLPPIRQGWRSLDAFTKRLAVLLTDLVPAADPSMPLLQEVLEASCLHFLGAGTSAPPCQGAARFLAAAVSASTRGLLSYTIEAQDVTGEWVTWCIHHGGLQDYLRKVQPRTMRFGPRVARPDERHAMKSWVMNQLLHFDDQLLLSRAGIDARTFEPY